MLRSEGAEVAGGFGALHFVDGLPPTDLSHFGQRASADQMTIGPGEPSEIDRRTRPSLTILFIHSCSDSV